MKSARILKVVPALLAITLLLAPGCSEKPDAHEKSSVPEIIKTKSGIEMVLIPAGSFQMGSNDGAEDEQPIHTVNVGSFLMDRYEVTQEMYTRYPLPDPSHFKNPDNPVEQINFSDAIEYCNERSIEEGLEPCYDLETRECNFSANGYRLPTEAEWEYACRGGTTTKYNFGNSASSLKANAWFVENCSSKTHPVGRKKTNPWVLFDMHGNVKEWCNDFYSETYYAKSPSNDPKGPEKGTERVVRGGSWDASPDACRSSYRAGDPSINDTCLASDAIGFRCVRNALKEKNNPVNDTEPKESKQRKETQVKTMSTDQSASANKTGLVYDDIYLAHDTGPGHPETAPRLTAIVNKLKETNLIDQLVRLGPPEPAPIEWITTVHSTEYVHRVEQSFELGMRYIDTMDVPISKESYEVALRAVGGVLSAVDAVMEGKVSNAFCAIRPPGHHALTDTAMGFCIFNNVAIAARYIQNEYKLEKILIVDWDVHHGNGTQAMFYDDPTVLYFSIHQYPFYPGTGDKLQTGTGPGQGFTINVPLSPMSDDGIYLRTLQNELKPAAIDFEPDFVLISAGFDAYEHDLLGGMKVTTEGFAQMTNIVKDIASQCCNGRIVSLLEGGYQLQGLANCVYAHIKALM